MSEQPRVVVTRRADQAKEFCDLLTGEGMIPLLFPAIELKALPAPGLDSALAEIDRFDWLIFSSANAVDFFFRRAAEGTSLPKIAVVGPATAQKLAEYGLAADFMPQTFTGEALAAGLGALGGQKLLLPRAKKGGPEIVNTLQEQGAIVLDIALYDTVTAAAAPEALKKLHDGYEAITFTSPSCVHGFLEIMKGHIEPSAVVACIGPVTAAAAQKAGLEVRLVPDDYTAAGLVAILSSYFKKEHQLARTYKVPGS